MKIRQRHRRGYVKEAGGHTAWLEFQVVEGSRVIARFDMRGQAERFLAAEMKKQGITINPPEGE